MKKAQLPDPNRHLATLPDTLLRTSAFAQKSAKLFVSGAAAANFLNLGKEAELTGSLQ
jgi:hypothetical protein